MPRTANNHPTTAGPVSLAELQFFATIGPTELNALGATSLGARDKPTGLCVDVTNSDIKDSVERINSSTIPKVEKR